MDNERIKVIAFNVIYEAIIEWGTDVGAEKDFVSYCDGVVRMACELTDKFPEIPKIEIVGIGEV